MAREVFRVEGLKELQTALLELPKATSRNVMRRALLKAGERLAADAVAAAPDNPKTHGYDLRRSIKAGTKLSRRQRRAHAKAGDVEAFVGAGPLPQAHLSEFGSAHQKPKPWFRPAWESNKETMLASIKADIAAEIEKARVRLAKKAARITGRR